MSVAAGIDMDAPVLADHKIDIDAPLAVVWQLLINVNSWTAWNPEITSAYLDGGFVTVTSFEWESYELPVTSTIYQVEQHRRILWGGIANGITAFHEWIFFESDRGVQIQTRESFGGPPVDADEAGMQSMLDESLASWLGRIKDAAEITDSGVEEN